MFSPRPAARRARLVPGIEQQLHHQDVLPLTVEPAVAVVDADLAPATAPKQLDAGLVAGEDLRRQLVAAALPRLIGDRFQQRSPDAAPPHVATYVQRALGDAGVVLGGVVVAREARPPDDRAAALCDEQGAVALGQLRLELAGPVRARLKGRLALLDPLVVNLGCRRRVAGTGGANADVGLPGARQTS
jgi:hypothetical protein